MSQTKQKPEEMVGFIPSVTAWPWGGPPQECLKAVELLPLERTKIYRVALLNAFVIPKKPMLIATMPTNPENVKAIIRRAEKIESYIGHEATAKLLSELLGIEVPVNRAEYEPQSWDTAVVVRLKRRLQTPQDVKEIKLEDLEFYVVSYEISKVVRWY